MSVLPSNFLKLCVFCVLSTDKSAGWVSEWFPIFCATFKKPVSVKWDLRKVMVFLVMRNRLGLQVPLMIAQNAFPHAPPTIFKLSNHHHPRINWFGTINCTAALQAYRLDLNPGELRYNDVYSHR
jgi:hypothetical protein